MTMRTVGYWVWLALVMTGILVLTADATFAQVPVEGGAGVFACVNGQAVGSLYQSGLSCPKTLSSDNIFSFLVCNMEQLSSNLMGNMFCGMVLGLAPAVQWVLVLATIFFAFGFMIGVIPATAREFQVFMLKVAFVWVFATQSEYLLDVAYRLLINGLRDGVAVVLTGYEITTTGGTKSHVYAQLDGFIGQMVRFATDYVGADPNNAIAGCSNALFAVMAVMAIAFPPIFFLGIALLMRVSLTFLRAIFGYVYALVGIAFLLTLAPFFLSFYLFKQTRPFFEKWAGYLVSFALQIVILFAFLAFILSVNNSEPYTDANGNGYFDAPEYYYDENLNGQFDTGEYFDDRNGNGTRDTSSDPYIDENNNGIRDTGIGANINSIVMPNTQAKEGGSFRMPWDYCTVCDFEVYDPLTGVTIPQDQYSRFISTGKLRCIKDPNDGPNKGKRMPMALDASASPNKEKINALMQFAGAGLMALLVMAYVLESLLAYVAALAQTLASGLGGATYAPQLGGGMNIGHRPSVGMPGEGLISDFEKGMDRGFATNKSKDGQATGRDGVSRSIEGIRSGFAMMLGGNAYAYDRDGNALDTQGNILKDGAQQGTRHVAGSGVGDRLVDFMLDPGRMNPEGDGAVFPMAALGMLGAGVVSNAADQTATRSDPTTAPLQGSAPSSTDGTGGSTDPKK